ncbi:MAG: hypothetical protein U1D96_02560 [Eubacteriales bacterium]|jgi:glutamate synthase domain-containing protein 3|nr:hypothetical protein [Bacillota bacterium]MBV1728123.1 hypothetical protein [Desulforudis sp.]MDQ7789799.1 hypothetical protein [Clostridia bacterium]MDZ4042360.1 hypothetical protein [Eubacteriales bacterium]MBU4532449.1 hypothetical protein [Bacillota bacterium]
MLRINADGIHYRELNRTIKAAVRDGETEIVLDNVNGQRYIGTGMEEDVLIRVNGVPGNDMASFMSGPTIHVYGNAQDGVANTMNAGTVVIGGNAGDVLGYGMRGGKVFVCGNVGYRVGIHMKQYQNIVPLLVVGGTAGNFFGEYMAGGVLVVMGMNRKSNQPVTGDYLATGMHGGVIYVRGGVDEHRLGAEPRIFDLDAADHELLEPIIAEFCQHFGHSPERVKDRPFVKLLPYSHRPYGRLYAF